MESVDGPGSNPLNLSILIVNWNTRDLLQGCLESLYAHLPQGGFEVIVVDNASTDGSAQMVAEHFPQVRLIQNAENRGFGRANNQAAAQAEGCYLLLLNPDTVIRERAVQALVDHLHRHPQVGAVGPCLLNPDGSLQVSAHPAPTLTREAWRLLHLDALVPFSQYPAAKWRSTAPQAVEVLMGACLLVRSDLFRQVGMFDEQFFIYSEEVDLCHRIRQAGWELHWLPAARVTHFGGQSTRQMADEMFIELHRNKIRYFRKHDGRLAAAGYKMLLLCHALGRSLVGIILGRAGAFWRQKALQYRRLILALPKL